MGDTMVELYLDTFYDCSHIHPLVVELFILDHSALLTDIYEAMLL